MGAPEVSGFLTALAVRDNVSASTQNQALSALLFLYGEVLRQPLPSIDVRERARRPLHLPVVLTRDEVRRVLAQLSGVSRLIASLLYGSGLRLNECLELRVKDVDFERRQLTVRRGKGAKDRVTMLPSGLLDPLRSISHASAPRIRRTWRRVLGVSCCQRRWPASIRTRRRSGSGSSCFRRPGSAGIPGMAGPPGITCTNPSSSGP